jgi:hypothetical protein
MVNAGILLCALLYGLLCSLRHGRCRKAPRTVCNESCVLARGARVVAAEQVPAGGLWGSLSSALGLIHRGLTQHDSINLVDCDTAGCYIANDCQPPSLI